VIVICGMAIGTIVVMRRQAPATNVAGFEPQLETPASTASTAAPEGFLAAQTVDPNVSAVRPKENTRRAANATAVVASGKKLKATSPTKVIAAPEADELGSALNALPITAAETSPAAAFEPSSGAVVEALPVARIAGCLERESGTFRLKDTEGADAPRTRSWKSGFLRKRASSVEVVHDAGDSPELSAYVGQRVEATGTLVNRQMRVRSLQVLGGACD
jgi:hypothetical protein